MAHGKDRTTYIAGKLTAKDWQKFRAILVIGGDQEPWARAFEDFLRQRLHLRYLKPIELLQKPGTWDGEGFSIVSIQCALIEFLAALRKGTNYRFLKNGETLDKHEYSKSGALFREFLSTVKPFDAWFTDAIAGEFYTSVRCALLHEACTKNGWIIWKSGREPLSGSRKIVYRDALQQAILDYVETYGR
ncbi:hypothetical protein FY136_13300 [Agrobacterium tumefaciens]|uniref:hypothetical protein n=1 Tax=Agrobacterium tumefaciens TaxID=358 RepID=UPI0021D2110E|nr:hypothetical protein [Agrobacterium tumefaciens]UXT50165.1 hypothetical protein FY136_13300 [Agrobacterium tumefaciens]